MLPFDQQGDDVAELLLQIIRTDPRYPGLEDHVAHDQAQNQGRTHAKAGFAVFFGEKQDHCAGDPEDAAVSQQGDAGHDEVQKSALEVRCDPVQNGQVKADCQAVQKI